MSRVKIPVQKDDFTLIYEPKGDTFPGPSTSELEAGKYYDIWVPNDHTFIKDKEGKWHIFGITHPITSTENVHEGEFMSFHAVESEKGFLAEKGMRDLPKVLTAPERPNERPEFYAPYALKKDDSYYMIYSPSPMRYATSNDLYYWNPEGKNLFEASLGRDPSIFYHNNLYHVVYCTDRRVGMRTSTDLVNWSEEKSIFEAKDFEPESPSIIVKDGGFYLFLCSWDGIWDKKEVVGAYQHKTYVFYSDKTDDFYNREPITMLNAHAPEIFKHKEQWYISSAMWPKRGISIDKLGWE